MDKNWQLAKKADLLAERARIIQRIRAFFVAGKFLEVETPHRIPANAPEFHIDAVASEDWFLHTSPELCMKRLLAAGYERTFQICRCWRKEESGTQHLPEYTMLEWYRAHCDYFQLMDDCEALLVHLCPAGQLTWRDRQVNLTRPWQRLTVAEAFERFSSVSLEETLETDRFDEIVDRDIQPSLARQAPTFLYDYPREYASLARLKADNTAIAERFELYIGGLELANAFSELNDPAEQRTRFTAEERRRRAQGKTPYPPPAKFLQELSNLPPAAGIALGIDRLVMLLCNQNDISNIVAFSPSDL